MKLYIITHKEVKNIYPTGRNIMMVGAYNKKVPEGYLSDYDGEDDISSKNPNFCELTGLYYMMKHSSDDIVGLEHYRRVFAKHRFGNSKKNFLQAGDVRELLKNYDIIMPKKALFLKTAYNQYSGSHYQSDLDEVRNIIREMYPEYLNSFDMVMEQRRMYLFNMFIGKSELIKEYAKWLFNILFELEKRIDINDRNTYQKRVYGFLSERLFNVWLKKHNDLKIAERCVKKLPNKAFEDVKKNSVPFVLKKKKIKLTIA